MSTSPQPDDDDRFGMPESAFRVAAESHGADNPAIRSGMYVPTRGEVATMAPPVLTVILIDWFYECPSELIPNDKQVMDVIRILESRTDATEFAFFIRDCRSDLLA